MTDMTTLDELFKLPSAMAAGEFRLDGKLVDYKMQWVPLRRAGLQWR